MLTIKTRQFEGPLHLLLELIESQKMDITRLSLVEVADDFLRHIEDRERINLANLSEFLLVASQLILMKSKALLPLFQLDEEEEQELGDLENRLREYQLFKKAGETIGQRLLAKENCFSKDEEKYLFGGFVSPQVRPEGLKDVFVKILQEIPTKEELVEEVMLEIMSLEEKMGHLRDSLEKRMKVAFHETVTGAKDKVEVIVTFLAMLEMIKQRIVNVDQQEMFGAIIMEKR